MLLTQLFSLLQQPAILALTIGFGLVGIVTYWLWNRTREFKAPDITKELGPPSIHDLIQAGHAKV